MADRMRNARGPLSIKKLRSHGDNEFVLIATKACFRGSIVLGIAVPFPHPHTHILTSSLSCYLHKTHLARNVSH
jgi:hypothetical protein